jgi:hypothetical protein
MRCDRGSAATGQPNRARRHVAVPPGAPGIEAAPHPLDVESPPVVHRLDFLAAAIKRSISAVVRYSRVRTEEFTVVGAGRPPLRFSTIFCPRPSITSELSNVSSLVSPQEGLRGHSWPPLVHNRPGRLEPFIRNGISREPIVRRPAHPRRLVGVLVIGRVAAKPQAQLACAPEGSVKLSLSLGDVGKLISAPRPKVTAAKRQV